VSGIWQPLSADWDAEAPRDPALSAQCYVVCSTPRSGSGMLCRGLAATGIGGAPAEYFSVNQRVPLSARWQTGPSLEAYTAALLARRSSAEGVFGTKLHWDQFDRLRAELRGSPAGPPGDARAATALAALLPNVRYVHLARLDVDRQAVSLWTALNRNVWAVRQGSEPHAQAPPVAYDFEAIEHCRQFLAHGELSWDRFFRAAGIVPIAVTYEELVADFAPTVQRVLDALLGDAARTAAPVPPPDSIRQSDTRSDELLARYRADFAERGVPLPAVTPPPAPTP
jgi:LPS sulfotransferase NodH